MYFVNIGTKRIILVLSKVYEPVKIPLLPTWLEIHTMLVFLRRFLILLIAELCRR